MGILDVVEEVGGGIVGAVTGLPSAAAGAVSLASAVVERTGALVGDLTGLSGLPDRVREVVQQVRGPIEGAIETVTGAIAHPRQAIERAASAARQGASRAITGAQQLATSVISGAAQTAEGIAGRSLNFAQQIARGAAAQVGDTASLVGSLIVGATTDAQGMVGRIVPGARSLAEGLIDRGGAIASQVIQGASGILQRVAQNLGDQVATGVRGIAGDLIRRATNLRHAIGNAADSAANNVGRGAQLFANGVSRVATSVSSVITSVAGTIAPHLPGPLGNLVTRGAGAVGGIATGISSAATRASEFVQRESLLASQFIATRSGEALAVAESGISAIRDELAGDAISVADIVAGGFEHIGQRLTAKIQERIARLHARIDSISQQILGRVNQAAQFVQQTVPSLVGSVRTGAQSAERALEERVGGGVQFVRDRFHEAVEGGRRIVGGVADTGRRALDFGMRAGERALDIGEGIFNGAMGLGRSAAGFAQGVAHGVESTVDRVTSFAMSARPNDGDLTGPFTPGEPMAAPESVAGLHGRSTAGAREGQIAGGAAIFINGIDTSLADHYRASQRLATEIGSPVVGVFNASAGIATDLLQCAADKIFDRAGNPATRTVTRLIRSYGDARRPNGGLHIFAHSQGSLILSEALRQAQGTGADLSGNEVTTMGNAAFTFPQGPQYHHYIHDDDAVAATVGTGSLISEMMNRSPLTSAILGPTADAQSSTVTLHHGGGLIDPHLINQPDGHDYIGDLHAFQAQERRGLPRGGSGGPRRTAAATGFAMARGLGTMAGDAASSAYTSVDSRIRSAPSLPGLRPNTAWGAMDSGLRTAGRGILGAGSALGSYADSYFSGLSTIQRRGAGADSNVDADAVKRRLDAEATPGFAPGTSISNEVGELVGIDPAGARFHSDPASARMANELQAEAFTIGRDVYFGAGKYDPASRSGLGLIAHELTHVAQQTGATGDGARFFSRTGGDEMERDAQRVGELVLAGPNSTGDLRVEEYHCDYTGELLSSSDHQRLDRISALALDLAERRAGALNLTSGSIPVVTVQVDIDLDAMSDSEAAGVWADAILREVGSGARAAPSGASPGRTPPRMEAEVQRFDSFEHVALGEIASGYSKDMIVLRCHDQDLPQRLQPTSTWPSDWQSVWTNADSVQKRAITQGLTYGEVLALSGDFYATFEDLDRAPLHEIINLLPMIRNNTATTAQLNRVTGGRYMALAKVNVDHFSPNNRARWRKMHADAIEAAMSGDMNRAWGMSAAADHFLTDAFAGGHIRTPRRVGGGSTADLQSKVLHDLDNKFGVMVTDDKGNNVWAAYGDDSLDDPRDAANKGYAIDAVKLSRMDIELAGKLGRTFKMPATFPSEDLIPHVVDPAVDRWTGRRASPFDALKHPRSRTDYDVEVHALALSEGPELVSGYFNADDDVRAWTTENNQGLGRQSVDRKAAMIQEVLGGWISDDDVRAVERITNSVTTQSELDEIRRRVSGAVNGMHGPFQRRRVRRALNRRVPPPAPGTFPYGGQAPGQTPPIPGSTGPYGGQAPGQTPPTSGVPGAYGGHAPGQTPARSAIDGATPDSGSHEETAQQVGQAVMHQRTGMPFEISRSPVQVAMDPDDNAPRRDPKDPPVPPGAEGREIIRLAKDEYPTDRDYALRRMYMMMNGSWTKGLLPVLADKAVAPLIGELLGNLSLAQGGDVERIRMNLEAARAKKDGTPFSPEAIKKMRDMGTTYKDQVQDVARYVGPKNFNAAGQEVMGDIANMMAVDRLNKVDEIKKTTDDAQLRTKSKELAVLDEPYLKNLAEYAAIRDGGYQLTNAADQQMVLEAIQNRAAIAAEGYVGKTEAQMRQVMNNTVGDDHAEWCGFFAARALLDAGYAGINAGSIASTLKAYAFFNYAYRIYSHPKNLVVDGVTEDVQAYHKKRGSERKFMPNSALGDGKSLGIQPGDVVVISTSAGGEFGDHIQMCRSYNPGTGHMLIVDGNGASFGPRATGAAAPTGERPMDKAQREGAEAYTGQALQSTGNSAGFTYWDLSDPTHRAKIRYIGRPSIVDFETHPYKK